MSPKSGYGTAEMRPVPEIPGSNGSWGCRGCEVARRWAGSAISRSVTMFCGDAPDITSPTAEGSRDHEETGE